MQDRCEDVAQGAMECPIDWENWKWDIHATLLFVVRGGEILLIRKKRGIGAGKVNGPGGKLEQGETPLQCAIRETEEELKVTPIGAKKMGELSFAMSDSPDIFCHVFKADDVIGIPEETDEAIPLWTKIGDIPFAQMWEDDQYWLPQMIAGTTFRARFAFVGEKISWSEVCFDVIW